jgi:peptidoglycan pentaglycine glycine transferase (the first glycine)
MVITESTDKTSWEEFNRTQKSGSILQSWDWAEFQAGRQQKIWRLEVKDNEKIIAQMFLWKHRFLIGQNGLYCPRGPVIADEFLNDKEKLQQILKLLFEKVHQIAKENKSLIFRIDPNVIVDLGNIEKDIWKQNFAIDEENIWKQSFESLGLQRSDREVQPAHTIMLDLTQSEDELLKKMHHKTRYNIRLAKKKGVEVIESENAQDFFDLLKQTTARQGFGAYPVKYFHNILKLQDNVKLYLAKYEGKFIAGILCTYYKNTAIYLFGASADEFRNVMAPHLLQWTAIKDAKEKGFEFYDFWGAALKDSKIAQEKSWQGITRFKQGFDPIQPIFSYFGAYSYTYRSFVLKTWNTIYKIYRIIRR